MSEKQKKRIPGRERGLRYPIEFVSAELDVDCETLRRACGKAGYPINGTGVTFAEAYDSLSLKSVSEEARRRKNLAEAEASEIDTLHKKKLFVFRTDHANSIRDLAVQTRVTVEQASYIKKEFRQRLIAELSDIKPVIAEPSRK